MSKVAHYLQEHLQGEVMTSSDARRYFSTDASIMQLAPALVAYPRNENDVRKTARFSWQLAERGRVIPLTARGAGTDQSGAALGSGIMLVFPAHMNRILELDTKANTVTVEPGISYGKLQQTLHTHGRFVPPYPASLEYSTVGGAVANNASGEKSSKYGDTRAFVQGLRVVLANGEVIETRRLSKREVNKKLGLSTFEGEIYRAIDALLEEQRETVETLYRNVAKNNAGYDLWDIRRKDGSVDLTPLFVGSQGTLGVITEVVLSTEPYNPQTSLLLTGFDSFENLTEALKELRKLPEQPSALEVVDGHLLSKVHEQNPNLIKDVMQPPYPTVVLLTEYDSADRQLKKTVKKASKIFEKYAVSLETTNDPEQQQQFWKLRQATSAIIADNDGMLKSVPLVDTAVPVDQIPAYITGAYQILKQTGIAPALWGHAGDGVFHLQPRLNLGQVGDRQKAFRLMDEFAKLALSLGGTVSGEAGDGRLRTPYLPAQYGAEGYGLLQKVKEIFDPYNTLNPGVKFGTSLEDIKSAIRPSYTLDHLYDHLPRS